MWCARVGERSGFVEGLTVGSASLEIALDPQLGEHDIVRHSLVLENPRDGLSCVHGDGVRCVRKVFFTEISTGACSVDPVESLPHDVSVNTAATAINVVNPVRTDILLSSSNVVEVGSHPGLEVVCVVTVKHPPSWIVGVEVDRHLCTRKYDHSVSAKPP